MLNKLTKSHHWGHSLIVCNDALNATLLRSVFFQMSQNWVCIRSVFEQKIGPYKVCIFGKVAALLLCQAIL